MIIDRLPRRKVGGQLAPLAAGAHHVQNPIHDLFLAMFVATAATVAGLKVVVNLLPVRCR
jgi:hypothetical protein